MRRLITSAAVLSLLAAGQVHAAPTRALRADLTYVGEATGDESGFQVEVADLDGDGIGDLIVGAWQNDEGGEASGAVYIDYGPISKGMNLSKADAKLFTRATGEYVGEGPLGVADMDRDGASELVIGAPGSFYATQPGSPGKFGEAFLLYGGTRLRGKHELPDVAHARFTGIHMTEWLGFGSSGVGDLDDDGFEEMLVGAPATAGFSGAAYLFYGGKDRLEGDVAVTTADAIFVGGRAGEMFGYEAAAGDVDDDGDDDLFVASKPLAGGPASIAMFQGGARITGAVPAATAHSLFPIATVDYFTGPALVSGADVTGDGIDDLVAGVGPYLNPAGETLTMVMGGSAEAFGPGPQVVTRNQIADAGDAIAIGDVNGDRKPDLVTSNAYTDGGTVYVLFGPLPEGALSLDAADATFVGEPDSTAGRALAVGKLNKDQRVDLVVGAPADAGRTYVVFGGR